jgi:hypothetical protein
MEVYSEFFSWNDHEMSDILLDQSKLERIIKSKLYQIMLNKVKITDKYKSL